MAFLYRIESGVILQAWEIGDQPVVVGRDNKADVKITDARVSRAHFAIVREGKAFVVHDLGSTNGTWLHGQRVAEERLNPSDLIRAGRSSFLFEEGLSTALETLAGNRAGDTQFIGTVGTTASLSSRPRT